MTRSRVSIADPETLDLSHAMINPLKFVVQGDYQPTGIVERVSEAITLRHTPWMTEVVIGLSEPAACAVLYQIATAEDSLILMACIGNAPSVLFDLATGDDYGDEAADLLVQQWPDFYGLLADSTRRAQSGRILARVVVPGSSQWVVVEQLSGAATEWIDGEVLLGLIQAALRTYHQAVSFPTELRGLVPVLGGPDKATRRLSAVAGLLSGIADTGSKVQDGVGIDEFWDLSNGLLEMLGHAFELGGSRNEKR